MILSYLALGSNLHHPEQQLKTAVHSLHQHPALELLRCSAVYRSEAVGPAGQPDYLNAVIAVATDLSPLALLDTVQAVEQAQGRVRSERWGPRTLDIDILFYGNERIDEPRLSVPHPEIAARNFVLTPLQDVLDDVAQLPDGRDINALLAACPAGELEHTCICLNPE